MEKLTESMKKTLPSLLMVTVGAIAAAFAVAVFYTPNKIVSGGVSGIATILYHTLHINQGYSFFAINVVLLLVSIKPLGKYKAPQPYSAHGQANSR